MKVVRLMALMGLWISVMAAQAAPLQFGVKAGWVTSKVSYSGSIEGFGDLGEIMNDNIENRSGWAGGLFATLGLGPMLSIQPELLFVQKGWIWEGTFDTYDAGGNPIGDWTAREEYRVDYLQVPVVARWTALPAGPVKPSVYAGPAMSFKLGGDGRCWVDGREYTNQSYADYVIQKHVLVSEWGAVLGAEVAVGHFLLDFRYELGLMDILKQGTGSEDVKTKSRSMFIMGGYRF